MDPDECNAVLVPPDKLHEILDKGTTIEYSGFCPVCFVRNGGILWKGDPCLGLVQTKDMKLYSFGDDDSKERSRYHLALDNSESLLDLALVYIYLSRSQDTRNDKSDQTDATSQRAMQAWQRSLTKYRAITPVIHGQ